MQEAKPELGLAYHRLGLTPDLSDDVVVNVYEQHIAQWPHSITLCECIVEIRLTSADIFLTMMHSSFQRAQYHL